MSKKELEIINAIKNTPSKYKTTRMGCQIAEAIEKVMGYKHSSHEDTYKVKKIIEGMVQRGYITLINGTTVFRLTDKFF